MAEKQDVAHEETLHEDVSKEDAQHMAELTEAEKMVEKKLRRKIDSLIMPLVVLVYLMNYIGETSSDDPECTQADPCHLQIATTTRQQSFKVLSKI